MFKTKLLVIVFTCFFIAPLFADPLINGINAYEDGNDQEAFEYFKESYIKNNNNLIARAFLQILTQQGITGGQFNHLPKDIRKKTFYNSKTIIGNYIEKQYIAPAKNYRSIIIEEKKYQNLVEEKKNKKLSKDIKKIEKNIKKQGDQIKAKISTLHKLADDNSQRVFSILKKDLVKNKNTYLSNSKIQNIKELQEILINLATRYIILIKPNHLQEIYNDLNNNALLEKGINFMYYTLLFYGVGYGDLEAIEEMCSITEDELTLFYQYLIKIKPRYAFLIKIIQKIIKFYLKNKEIINNNEELQFQMASLYTNEASVLDDLSPQNRPPLIPFDLTSMQHLACLGNTKAFEWLSLIFMRGKKYNEAAYYAKIGYDLGNINCGFLLSKIIRQEEENTENLKKLYASLLEQCKTKFDAEYLICEISSFYYLDGLINQKVHLIDNSFVEYFKKIINLSLIHNLPNHEKLFQYATLVGLTFFLKTKDHSCCAETYNWALLSYDLDPTSTNLFILCQILSNPDWPHESNKPIQKYVTLFLDHDLALHPIPFENIDNAKGAFAFELASIYLQEKNYKEAANYFKKAIDLGSNAALIPYASVCIYYLDEVDYNEVKKILIKAINANISKEIIKKGYFLIGFIELLQSNYAEADQYFEIGKQLGSKDATFHHSITQKILDYQLSYEHSANNESLTNPNDDSSSSDTTPIISDGEIEELIELTRDFTINDQIQTNNLTSVILNDGDLSSSDTISIPSDDETEGPKESIDDFDVNDQAQTTHSSSVDSNEASSKKLSLSSEIDYEPWKKYPSSKKSKTKKDIAYQGSTDFQDTVKSEKSSQKRIKIDKLVAELKKSKLKKREMTKYLSRLLSLVDKKAYITSGEAVRVKFNVGDMVLPMHIQHPSAGNMVEAGRLKKIQAFVDEVVS